MDKTCLVLFSATHFQFLLASGERAFAAGHSGLATWSYPACDYLEKASESMKAKEKMMQAAGRFDAYICSRSEAVNGYGKPDLSRCPTVFSREQIEAGEHKR